MLLQKLVDYSERLDLPPTLYRKLPVRYVLNLDGNGRFTGLIDTADPASRATRRGQSRPAPEVQRAAGIKPLLLCDKADYVLGYVPEDGKPERVRQCHEAFVELTSRCYKATGDASIGAVLDFLTNDPLSQTVLPDDFAPADRITFAVQGVFPIDLPAVQTFWAAENDPAQAGAVLMQCVVCGQQRPVLDRLQEKIKGVPGGQTSGTSIISANAEAFESYGLEASLIAPTCAQCGERFTKAANDLLSSSSNRTTLAGAAFIYWTQQDVGFDIVTMMTDPAAAEVKALLDSIRSGQPTPVDETRFYATVLTGSGGRTVVRDWIDTTIGEVSKHLRRWFARQAVVGLYGETPRPLGLAALAGATVRDLRDVPKPTTRALLHSSLTGQPLPMDLLYQAVRRSRADQGVTRAQAALIRLVGTSRGLTEFQEDKLTALDQKNTNAAYRCGRLLAVLENTQVRAIPNINATVADRFFGSASSAPASVFPRLVQGSQAHLAKLRSSRSRHHAPLLRRIEEILDGLPVTKVGELYKGFPVKLTGTDQGLFILGYYHQRAFDREQAITAAALRKASATLAGSKDTPDDDAPDSLPPDVPDDDSHN